MQLKGKKIRKVKVDMEWNGSTTRRFVPRAESSFSFLYNNNNYYHTSYPGMEVKQQALSTETPPAMEKLNYSGNHEKKKRLTCEQLDSLESSFQQEIKLDPDRKMKLSKELGLQPRQIAVWFQNRRARWKTKQLEHLYDTLKQEFDAIAKEKHKLEEEVMKLKGMLREQGCRTQQVSAGYTTEVSAEETVESTSELALRCSKIHHHHHQIHQQQQNTANADQGNCSLTHTHSHMAEDCSTVPVMSYWPGLPYYP